MRMSTPYVGTKDYGILTMTQQEIDEAVEDAHRHNFRVAIHANGDVTIDMVLQAYEKVLAKYPRPDTGFASSTVHWSIPICCVASKRSAQSRLRSGPMRIITARSGRMRTRKMQWMFAHKSFLETGIPVLARRTTVPGRSSR